MNETAGPAASNMRRTFWKYGALALALAPVVLGAIVGAYYVRDNTPRWIYWAAGLIVCWIVDVCYILAVASACVGLPLAIRALRRRRTPRAPWLRIATLSGSILMGAAVLEAASWVILGRQAHQSVMPAGDLDSVRVEQTVRGNLPVAREDVELPTAFPPDDGRTNIVVVGESSAQGVPFNRWLSIGSVVADQLSRAIPGRRFETETLAGAGDTLEIQHRKMASMQYRPDLLIVYCGHNEFAARIPLRRDLPYYHDALAPSLAARATAEALAWSSFHRLMRRNAEKCRIAIPPPDSGRRALVDVPAYLTTERSRLLDDFRRRLGLIADYADEVGAILVLIAPPANDSDYDPNRSFLPAETSHAERRSFEAAFLAAKDWETSDPSTAIGEYRTLLTRAPGFAATHWRLSRLLAARGDVREAYEHAVAARDLDGYPQRCPTEFQDVYREIARRHPRSIYIDGQAYFHAISPDGLLDDRLFHDAMHPSYRGQIAMAQAVLRGLHQRRAFDWPADALAPVVDPADVARRFGLDEEAWRFVTSWGTTSYQITGPASFDPTVRRRKEAAFQRGARRIAAGVPPGEVGLAGVGRLEPIPIVPFGDVTAPRRQIGTTAVPLRRSWGPRERNSSARTK